MPIPSEGPEPDVFPDLVAEPVPVVASASLHSSGLYPARCLVDGVGVAQGLNEGLNGLR